MLSSDQVFTVNHQLPIRTQQPVHQGKVRAVYWLTPKDSLRLIQQKNYQVALDTQLAVMVISDRISAFDCIWQGADGLKGVPGKGAALNQIAYHWFNEFKNKGIGEHHILDMPHPWVWIVQKARPIKIEAICRQYLTGSIWRAYEKGERIFCGLKLPDHLKKDQALPKLLLTPSTKGILRHIPNVPALDDTNISKKTIQENYQAFGFRSIDDIKHYESLLKQGFACISQDLIQIGQRFIDTKFEFGYVTDPSGQEKLIFMDEVGTPDSSRMWDDQAYQNGRIIENSKEAFRQFLLHFFDDPDILLNSARMDERTALARQTELPSHILHTLSQTYLNIAKKITGKSVSLSQHPKQDMIQILAHEYQLIEPPLD